MQQPGRGNWRPTAEDAARLREFCLRGGFLLVDDLHGEYDWSIFENAIKRVFPDRPIVDIPQADAIFHTVYDLDERYQIVGAEHLEQGHKKDGYVAHWRGIYDDKGRVMVAICHNMDLGDAWEWSDDPAYPEKWASLAYRIAVNYTIYAMTH